MTPWQVVFTMQAQKDARRLSSAGLRPKAEQLLDILAFKDLAGPSTMLHLMLQRPAKRRTTNQQLTTLRSKNVR